MMIVSVAIQSEGNMDGCKMGATEAAPGHLKRGSKFHSTLMRDFLRSDKTVSVCSR
jgi:hypothetical protein